MTEQSPLIDCYHDLILREYSLLEKTELNFEDSRSRLSEDDVENVATRYDIDRDQLLSQGLLVRYPDSTFRTMHIDLIFRAVNLRAAEWSPKIPLEHKVLKPRVDYLPSFTEVSLGELKGITALPADLAEILCKALRDSGYGGIAFHQKHFLQKFLHEDHRCYLLVSPTASGKSLIFYLAILVDILSRITEKGTKAIILYPRKALASDQLFKFLRVVYSLNSYLSAKGMRKITIGLDDGDTPRSTRSDEVRRASIFRGIKCTKVECSGSLKYSASRDRALIVCDNPRCRTVYDEILVTKGDIWTGSPDIVFSNLSALNRRMMMVPSQDLIGPSLSWIILDEAHTYREELGGHARWLLRRLDARFEVLTKGKVKFVISSATIPKPVQFAKKLIGITEQIYYEPYDEVLKSAKHKFRKLILDVVLAPNPLRSAESLAEELALLLGVWGFANSKKAVLFVDNVSEVERIYDFVVDTIIQDRAEHNDHLNPSITPSVTDVTRSFSWQSIAQNASSIDSTQLASIYDFHNAELQPEERARVENRFKSQSSGLIFSTSTLELGIDIGDIAAIIQYKVPLTSESYTQRVGRAGRSDKVLRVALGMLVLTNSPSQVRFVLGNEYLRLIDPEKIDPYIEIPIAWENEEIRKQHMIFSILDILAARGHRTYLDYTSEVQGYWSSVDDVINSLKELCGLARRELESLRNYANSATRDPKASKTIEQTLERIEIKLAIAEKRLVGLDARSIEDSLSRLRNAETSVTAAVRSLHDIRSRIEGVLQTMRLDELQNHDKKLLEVEESLRRVLSALERMMR